MPLRGLITAELFPERWTLFGINTHPLDVPGYLILQKQLGFG